MTKALARVKKRKVGRPPGGKLFDPEFHIPKLLEHMGKGLSYTSLKAVINVNEDTLFDWEKRYPEWKEAKEIGFALALLWWENALKRAVENGEPFNNTAYIFTLKSRFNIGTEIFAPRTVVQVKHETNVNAQGNQQLVQEFKDVLVKYKDERKEQA